VGVEWTGEPLRVPFTSKQPKPTGRRTVSSITVQMTKERETKGTWRYAEVGPPAQHKIGTLYIKKSSGLGGPDEITVEVQS
jgi:hypothetical protein